MSTERWLLKVESRDQPGIVASITSALASAGCNLADVSMTRLNGLFVMLAIVSVPAQTPAVFSDVDSAVEKLECDVEWHPIEEERLAPQLINGIPWNVTVYGSDRPGIVAAVTAELASRGANIDDLSTRITGDAYTMLISVTVPAEVDIDVLTHQLTTIGENLGVTCHAQPVDLETL